MANLITFSRLLLLFILLALAYLRHPAAQIVALLLLIAVFIMDGLDGWVARRRGESTLFGSVFDIAADRIVENMLWVVLAHLHRVPIWVPLIFLGRGILVDSIRSIGISRQETPFGMMKSAIGRFIVAGRFMRNFYGVIKTVAFIWLFLLPPMEQLAPEFWTRWQDLLHVIAYALVGASLALCLIRGLPVVIEFMLKERVLALQTGTRA